MNQESRTALRLNWGRKDVTLSNTGNAVSIGQPATAVETSVGSNQYTLLRCDFRAHSEHTLMTEEQALEVQCVHNKVGGAGYGVVAMMWKLGETYNSFLAGMTDGSDNLPGRGGQEQQVSLNFDLLWDDVDRTKYWSYDGSMTTPPCAENVDWYVLMDRPILQVSQQMRFQEAIGWDGASPPGNFRPPQPLYDRSITGCSAMNFEGGCECMSVTYPDTGEVVPAACGPHQGDTNDWCYIHDLAEGCGTGIQVMESSFIDGLNFKYCNVAPSGDIGEVSAAPRESARALGALAFAGAAALCA